MYSIKLRADNPILHHAQYSANTCYHRFVRSILEQFTVYEVKFMKPIQQRYSVGVDQEGRGTAISSSSLSKPFR